MTDDIPQVTELGNNTLLINHAGFGETPSCPIAKYHVGQVLTAKWRRKDYCSVAAIVPPGFAAEYAWADLLKKPRPLMITKPKRTVQYIVGFEGDQTPWLYRESHLFATDRDDSPVRFE